MKNGVAGLEYAMSGGKDEKYHREHNSEWMMSTALFLEENPQPLTKKRMEEEAAAIFDSTMLKTAKNYPYAEIAVEEYDGTLWESIESEYSFIRWDLPEKLPIDVWGPDEDTVYADLDVYNPIAGISAMLRLEMKWTKDGWRVTDSALFRALYLDEGPDWIEVEMEGSATKRLRLGEYCTVLPDEIEKDGKYFAYWQVDGYSEPEARLSSYCGRLDLNIYLKYYRGSGTLHLVPVYLTLDEWFESFPEEDKIIVTDADLEPGADGRRRNNWARAIKLVSSRYPFSTTVCGYDGGEKSAPQFVWFAGSSKVIENSCIWGYDQNRVYCAAVSEGVEQIEHCGIGPERRMVYLPKSLKDCMFWDNDCGCRSEDALKDVIIYYAGSKEEFEKINFHTESWRNKTFLENAHIFYNVNY